MFSKRMMLRYVLLCLLFFLPIEGASATLNQPLIVPNEQKSYDAITITIEHHTYHRKLLLVRGYTRQHAPCYVVYGLKKIITGYAYEAPVPIRYNCFEHKWCTYVVASFCATFVVGVTVVVSILFPRDSSDPQVPGV